MVRVRAVFRQLLARALFVAAFCIVAGATEAKAEDINVAVDRRFPIQLSEGAEGVAIGNPSIAQVTVQNDRRLLVTGRSPGSTNLVVVGEGGRVLYSGRVVVTPADGSSFLVDSTDEAPRICNSPWVRRPDPTAAQIADAQALTLEIERRARELRTQTDATAELLVSIATLSQDSARLAFLLQDLRVEMDLPCIFAGISHDTREAGLRLQDTGSSAARDDAWAALRVVLDDAILIAPMAASAVADVANAAATPPPPEELRSEPGSTQRGVASVYAENVRGRRTESGEIFDPTALTAAHPTLDIPSIVQITNLENGREVIVRVNDRTAASQSVLVVTPAAAAVLGFGDAATVRVHVRYLGPAPRRANAE